MTVNSRQIIDDYLRALEEELRDLSPSDRAEIILEVREHFDEARRELQDPTEADLRNIVERLGPPGEIAAEARRRLGVGPSTDPGPASAAATLPRPASAMGGLEIAALIGWVVWLPLGILLMALSSRWTARAKATAVLIELGFFAVLLGALITPVYFTRYYSASHLLLFFPLLLLFPPTISGMFGAAYLSWKLTSPGHREWSAPWKVAGRTTGVIVGAWLLWVLVLGPLALLVRKVRSGG